MGKIQISSLSSRSCILCRLASGSWGEKLIWDMESWDIQKLRARLCLTFRLNHELDTSNSLCCMLLFAKLAETLSNSEIVPNKIFFLYVVDSRACNRKMLLFFQVYYWCQCIHWIYAIGLCWVRVRWRGLFAPASLSLVWMCSFRNHHLIVIFRDH